MADQPFDRTIIHPREKPLSVDINQEASQVDRTIRALLSAMFSDFDTGDPIDGFIQQGFKALANSPADMNVLLKAGFGFQNIVEEAATSVDNIVGLNDLSTYKPIVLANDATLSVPSAPTSPNTRVDIIEVRASLLTTEPSDRRVLNTGTGVFEPATLKKILSFVLDDRIDAINAPNNSVQPVSYKVGIEGNPGAVPATTDGYIKVAEIAVGSDVTSITDANITDYRPKLSTLGGSGEKLLPLTPFKFVAYFPNPYAGTAVDLDLTDDLGWVTSGAGAGTFRAICPVDLFPGTRVTGALAQIENKAAAATFTFNFARVDRTNTAGGLVTLVTGSTTSDGDVDLTIDHLIESGWNYYLQIEMDRTELANFAYAELRYKDR